MKTRQELDKLDEQYPNIFTMPKDVRARYDTLSLELISDVMERRAITKTRKSRKQ